MNCVVQVDSTPFRQWYEAHYAVPLGRKKGKQAADATESEELLAKKRSPHCQKKMDARKANAKIAQGLEEQFVTGRLYACVSSRPGQSGRCDGLLFRKHKYRRRWDDDARYQPKEVFIKVNFDAENGEPLRITWGTGNRHVEWDTVKLIAWGLHTPTYTAMQQRMNIDPKTCFSVVSTHTILDVQNDNTKTVEMWVKGLRHLLGQSDEEADKLSDELRKHPPTTRKRPRRKKEPEPKKRKDRTESLILLQKDLFILTTTTVFRNLEEQYYPITQEIKQEFNPNDMYKLALEEDISWRKWQPWLTEKVINRMR